MRRLVWCGFCVVLLFACSSSDECLTCTITAEPLATFGTTDGDGALSSYPLVGPELGGTRIVLQPDAAGELPRLYSSRGKFQRVLGRLGDGPGEFRGAGYAMRSGDSLLIIDRRAKRLVVMQLPDRVVRTSTWMSYTSSAVELRDGSLVSTDAVWLPGRPFEHLSREGTRLRLFGDSLPAAERARMVVPAPDGSFWAAPRTRRLTFEHWASPTARLESVEVVTPHYVPYEKYVLPGEERRPSSSLRGFWVDSASHLWLVIEVPGVRWREGYGAPRRGEGGFEFLPLTDWESAWDTVVLEYDPIGQRVLTERQFTEAFVQVESPGVVSRLMQDEDGWYQAQLYRIARRAPP